MEELFKVINLDSKTKIGNLKTEAHSKVKSTKYFPIYMIDGKKMIFKPLSKTKPLTTPFFAYSEVYWSYVIRKYFNDKTPRYYLAISNDIEKEQPKYYSQGVLVESNTPNDEQLINLYDYFSSNNDPLVDIKDYVNYCMKNYDYTKILLSKFFNDDKERGKELANQILLSILRQDQNFHYENINMYDIEAFPLAPPIDFEFSTPFLYPDKKEEYQYQQDKYISNLSIKYEEDMMSKLFKTLGEQNGIKLNSILISNVCLIVKLYPDEVLKFIKKLDIFIDELPNIKLSDPDNYIGNLNSDYWEVGHAYYKGNDIDKYKKLKSEIVLKTIDKESTFKRISSDILSFSKYLSLLLKMFLLAYYNGIEDLEELTIKKLLMKLDITEDVLIKDINIDTKELKLIKKQ